MCYFGLIWRSVHAPSTEAMEAESSGPEMQVMDPHGAGLVFRNYTRPSCPSGLLHSVLFSSLTGKQSGGCDSSLDFEKMDCKGKYMM